ncbi:hypothetical protein BT63DRAFT_319174 [Microthyrium microscopicum]|uniref:F-box domain-containing protein n=1 Tax=Microthyrium microscopicum TaxID=703497 RepID=A0A6A6U5T0_9PEZI|nr:hypothetical protein BT63DRAFT_319174 [Microthyrium microscopicum]
MDDIQQSRGVCLFDLPAEIRAMVYQSLLISDTAYRLGHHGPYSHEKRDQNTDIGKIYPSILATCQAVFAEASEVLYGDNTFYLGPVGHKPTYSASFITSIGAHNAAKIRTLVAHCVHPIHLSPRYLKQWISSYGLDISRVKVLAISFSPCITGENSTISIRSYPSLPAISATLPQYMGPPGGHFHMMNHLLLPGSHTTLPPAPNVVGSNASSHTDEQEMLKMQIKIQFEYALMEGRMADQAKDWVPMVPASRQDVMKWAELKNTDLRSGKRWLLYVCPTFQRKLTLRF